MDDGFLCPVCGKYNFDYDGDDEECEVCGWINDGFQNDWADFAYGQNDMSLNQAREAYKNGEKIH